MILKKTDDKTSEIAELEQLLKEAPEIIKPKIQREINMLRAGIKGEQESAYHIDFNLRNNENYFVIHDLRLEINGNVAQIDHVLINRTLDIFSLETKHFNAGIKINDDGEFLQWNSYKKVFEGIPSPLAQNQRHIRVLSDVFKKRIELPTKFGFSLTPTFHSRILVNNDSRIDRSKKYDSSNLVKSEQFFESIKKDFLITNFDVITKGASADAIEEIGRKLARLHKPIKINYRAKFALDAAFNTTSQLSITKDFNETTEISNLKTDNQLNEIHCCKKCKSSNVKINYGKFGYYFKCLDCDGNTTVKIDCRTKGHSEKLRKEGNKFFRECSECKTSSLYFQN